MKNFRTYQLAVAFYKESQKVRVKSHLRDQLDRAAASVAANLAEGSAKPTAKDRRKYYRIALGSLREVQCFLELSANQELLKSADILGAHLYKLCLNT